MLALFLSLSPAFANPVTPIREAWTAAEARIAAGDATTLTIDWNAKDTSWAAIGNYARTLTAWYVTTGENAYPDTVLKIHTRRQTSARQESHTFLYAPNGTLRFAMAENPDHPTLRAYWDGTTLVRVQVGESVRPKPSTQEQKQVETLRGEGENTLRMARSLIEKPPPVEVLEQD